MPGTDEVNAGLFASLIAAIQFLIVLNNNRIALIRQRRALNLQLLNFIYDEQRNDLPREPYCRLQVFLLLDLLQDPDKLKKHCRVGPAAFQKLLDIISLDSTSRGWNDSVQLLCFLFWLACGSAYRIVSAATGIPRSSVCNIVHRMLNKVLKAKRSVVKLPHDEVEIHSISEGFQLLAHSEYIDRAVGSIDGTHIKIMPPDNRREDYINHKLFYSINMQAVCNHKGVFIDVFAGYPGSVHDARVLRCSPLYRQEAYPPQGYYIIGDSAYPCTSRPLAIITPYKAAQSPVQQRFNYHLSRARTIIERSFGRMKTRWRSIFTKTLEISPVVAPKIAVACAIMHNICIMEGDEWGEENEDADDAGDADEIDQPVEQLNMDQMPRNQESGELMRQHIAAQISAPAHLVHHLNEHDYN